MCDYQCGMFSYTEGEVEGGVEKDVYSKEKVNQLLTGVNKCFNMYINGRTVA